MGMPFCLLLWFHHKDEDLYNRIFIWKDLTVYPMTRTDARFFSASLLFLKWKWLCCAAYSLANGAQLQTYNPVSVLSRQWGCNICLQSSRSGKFWNLRGHDLHLCLLVRACLHASTPIVLRSYKIHFCDFLRSSIEEPLAILYWNPGFGKLSHTLIWFNRGQHQVHLFFLFHVALLI